MKPLFTVAAGTALLVASLVAQTPGSSHDAHLRAFDAHRSMASSSAYKSLAWSFLGPTNVGGRAGGVAVAHHGTEPRLYAGTCCGGVWKSADLGKTWQVVFDQAAATSTGA